MMIEKSLDSGSKTDLLDDIWSEKLESLQQRINDDDYLHAAIQRLALVLSNELMEITTEGGKNERQRKRRK
jgi:hypothetical protein